MDNQAEFVAAQKAHQYTLWEQLFEDNVKVSETLTAEDVEFLTDRARWLWLVLEHLNDELAAKKVAGARSEWTNI